MEEHLKEIFNWSFDEIYGKSSSENEYTKYLVCALDYLNELDDASKVFTDPNAYAAMVFVGKTVAFKSKPFIYVVFEEKYFAKFISELVNYFYTIRAELNFAIKIDLVNSENLTNLEEKRTSLFSLLMYVTNIYVMNSINFCVMFSANNGLKGCLQFLSDEKFLETNLNATVNMWNKTLGVVDYMVMNVSAISKACDENKHVWLELDSINILLKIAKKKEATQRDAYIAIINIADDKQIENLIEMNTVKNSILALLNRAIEHFNENRYRRENRQIQLQGKSINCNVHCLMLENQTTMSIIVILRALYKLSINDKMKNELYFGDKLLMRLKVILEKGNYFEIFYALEILAQFSFEEKITKELKNDQELDSILKVISHKKVDDFVNNDEKNIFKGVEKFIEQLSWNFIKKTVSDEKLQSNHVMISYNTASRELCLKIKADLESYGVKVWIDVDDIHGSSLDAMAKAVENSSCILICITEKYRQSVNCQAEAQYAFRLNKKIIPLIMQTGYESVQGWLGIIMGDKIFVNFTKYELKECFKRLRKEVKRSMDSDLPTFKEPVPNELKENNSPLIASIKSKNHAVENMTENEVKDWFAKKNLNIAIYEHLRPCCGKVLFQIYSMKKDAPEFFYQSLKEIPKTNLSSISLFAYYLEKLIE